MRSIRTLVLLLLLLATSTVPARAQCSIAAYGDRAGTLSVNAVFTEAGVPFSFYVVMFTEDTAMAAAYKVIISDLGNTLFLYDRIVGPSGNGLIIDETTGTNVALAECVYGFGGTPVLVEEYVLIPVYSALEGWVALEANLNQGPTPLYVTCTNIKKPCEPGPILTFLGGFPNEATSFGAVKSLYHR